MSSFSVPRSGSARSRASARYIPRISRWYRTDEKGEVAIFPSHFKYAKDGASRIDAHISTEQRNKKIEATSFMIECIFIDKVMSS